MNIQGMMQLTQVAAEGGAGYFLGAQRALATLPVSREQELIDLIQQALESVIGPVEGVASGIIFRSARTGDLAEIPAVCSTLAAHPLPPEMRQSSLEIGHRLWETSRQWPWAGAVHQQVDTLVQTDQLPHAVAFGALVSETTNSQVRAIATYLFHAARAIVGTAVRVTPLDERAGMHVLARVQEELGPMAARFANKEPGDIGMF